MTSESPNIDTFMVSNGENKKPRLETVDKKEELFKPKGSPRDRKQSAMLFCLVNLSFLPEIMK